MKLIVSEFAEAMLRSAYLINIARGALVDETALLTALPEGWIAGAGLDAFITEPLPPESPLWSLPNLFGIPHNILEFCLFPPTHYQFISG